MPTKVEMPSVIPGAVAAVAMAAYLSRGDNLDRIVFHSDGEFGAAFAMDTLVGLLPKVLPATYRYSDLIAFGLIGGMYAYGKITEKGQGSLTLTRGLAGATTGLAFNSLIMTPMLHKVGENRAAREAAGEGRSSATTSAVPPTVRFRLR